MECRLINPRFYIIRKDLTIGIPLELRDNNQIEETIRKILLQNSIIADDIVINRKKFKNSDSLISAEELVESLK